MKPPVLPLLVMQLLAPLLLNAQPQYRLGPDTLRYREQTQFRQELQVGDSVAVIETDADASIAVVLRANATAWYERLILRQARPGAQHKSPATAAVIGEAFAFAFTPRGRVTVHQSPAVPQEIFVVFDVTRQFDDFFISLPNHALKPGVTWADTTLITNAAYPTHHYRASVVRRYRAERDTTVDSSAAVLISVRGVGTIDFSAPVNGVADAITGHTQGEETGLAIVTADGARLIGRQREGWARGRMTVRAGGRAVAIPTSAVYRGTLNVERR